MSINKTEIKKVRSLQTKKGRKANGQFVAEGIRLLEEAWRFKARPIALYAAPSMLSERGRRLVGRFGELKITAQTVSAADLNRMTGAETTQGLLAVYKIPATNLSELHQPSVRTLLVVENLSDPGNIGTLVRTALAFDFGMVIMCGQGVDPFSPKVVRSSVGAMFGLQIAIASTEATLEYLKREGYALLVAALSGSKSLKQALPAVGKDRLALAIGSESDGLSGEMIGAARGVVRIQHSKRVESLNSAVAGSILMRECYDAQARRKR